MTLKNNFFDFTKLFWSIEVAFVALPFYVLGNQISNKIKIENLNDKVKQNSKKMLVAGILMFLILSITSNLNKDVSMR